MSWQTYSSRLEKTWASLLDGQPSEPEVQSFLEQHPALVPGSHQALGRMKTGHGPFPSALITQPTLQGLLRRTPDFLWISTDSLFLNPVFIEIEAPGKRWITKRGQQHHHLTQALDQVDEWDEWFNEPSHRQIFYEAYRIPLGLRRRKWEPIWVLVYGRRQENPDGVDRLRARLQSQTRFVIPYEHLAPDQEASNYLCVRHSAGRYTAVSVPPTVHLGPMHARDWRLVDGKGAAAARGAWTTRARKKFLVERFPYWDEWASGDSGLVRLADRE
jgi:hypothetical protein